MDCSICNRPMVEGQTMTMYTLKNSNERLFAHDECLAGMIAKDMSELQVRKPSTSDKE